MMGRGAKFAYGNRATKRKAIGSRKKDKVSDESDEDYVIGEEESYEEESSEGKFARGNGGRKRKKEIIRSREKRERCSDDSDEDYVIGEDESDDENSEDYCASSALDVSEESFDLTATGCSGDSWDEGRKAAARSKPRKGFAGRGKLGAKRRKCGVSRVSVDSEDCVEDEDEDEEFMPDADDCLDDDEEGSCIRRKKKSGVVRNRVIGRKGSVKSRKRRESGGSRVLVDSDDWVDDEDEDEDEEFIPDAELP